ncbi:MAG: type II toxin-antitoxin system VapC family toxin [Cyclobacteriaceae bacterium]|nr:type II toxin-antitoxin system VapC family toxin [Cyclobacteriaceae bacterium]
MSGHKYLADTNAFIFLLNRHPAIKPVLDSEWSYSFITEIELKGKTGITTSELKKVADLLSSCTKIPFTEEISQHTISLRQQYRIKIPDAIIAATSLYRNIPLLTFDKDFTLIKSLDIILLEP